MKKFLQFFVLLVGAAFILCFLFLPKFNQEVREFIVANVMGGSLCPKSAGNIFEDELLVQVNKDIPLPANYVPKDLVKIPKDVRNTNFICLKKDAVSALKLMFADALKENINLAATSGFRSFDTQARLYQGLIDLKGEKAKDRIAKPMHSEHHLGTTLDISGESIGYLSADDKFMGTPEDLWLQFNAYKYGFILSYPKDKTKVTGYDYEPWHYRYVGEKVAKEIFDSGATTEEYFDSLNKEN